MYHLCLEASPWRASSHSTAARRPARITDAELRSRVEALAWAISGDVRVFASTAEDEARAWITT